MAEFYGKYRGKVVNNVDPLMLGRILPLVPAVSELPLTWAMPNVPFAGQGQGFFALPPIGANVWIEFEGGDPNYPIWTGCFWGDGQVPASPAVPTTVMLKTELITLTLDDLKGELKLEARTPGGVQTIEMTPAGIKLSSDEVTVTLSQETIELRHTASTGTIAPQGVALKSGSAAIDVTPASIGIKNGGASAEVTPASISLENGAASVDLSPASVSLNKGALEVM
ncbi:MAG: phage baseplate assembly protein V [Anaerolineae bacterium]|jgi:hypothetical protein